MSPWASAYSTFTFFSLASCRHGLAKIGEEEIVEISHANSDVYTVCAIAKHVMMAVATNAITKRFICFQFSCSGARTMRAGRICYGF